MSNVLHVIPESAFANTYHGCYKDVMSRVRWLEGHARQYRQLRIPRDDPAILNGWEVSFAPSHALVEYTSYPRIVRALRERFHGIRIIVRAHNIEPLQHLDNVGWFPRRGPWWVLYGMARLAWLDAATKRHADCILSINDWENRRYWDLLPGKARVDWLPYVCPEHLIPNRPMPFELRSMIACFPASSENRKSRDMVLRFFDYAREMKRQGCPYDFVVTGRLDKWNLPYCAEVNQMGFVDDLAGLLGQCRAVAILSPLGYGFKTTMADAWAAGAHVLAHPDLIRRSPELVRPHLIPVDTTNPKSFSSGLEKLGEPSAGRALHDDLRAKFLRMMQNEFGAIT